MSFFARLSTGTKMLLILGLALFPLGMIALLASVESARANRTAREAQVRMASIESANRLGVTIGRTVIAIRATATALAINRPGAAACRRTLESLAANQGNGVRFALFEGAGTPVCATAGFRPVPPRLPVADALTLQLLPAAHALRLVVPSASGSTAAVAELPQETLASVVDPHQGADAFSAVLRQGAATLPLVAIGRTGPLDERVSTHAMLLGGRLALDLNAHAPAIRAVDVLLVLLPVLMWLAAAAVGWVVVDRLILRPLAVLHHAVRSYRAGSESIALPQLTTPSQEIRRLGKAFAALAATVRRHERELEEGLARQTKLTREVHHRVKNNLQVIASLISLHARGARSAEAADAYASIQRRVDALAVVFRNHYAEMEENRGVALRPLIGELSANLRANVPGLAITLAVEPRHAHQDVAVPVAFLLTETVELAMVCDPHARIAIRLEATEPHRALLSVSSSALTPGEGLAGKLAERYGRVLEGLSRQLRARLQRDEAEGRYAIEIAVLD